MIRVGIYGATGYAGIELVKLLQRHPQAKIVFATSRSEAGKSLADVYPTLINLPLVDPETVDPTQADVIFTCLPHGAAELVPIVRQALELGVRVVDFSDTFRLSDAGRYERHMGKTHPAPDLLRQTVYGMPEIHRERIHSAQLVGNTGCYPVTVILALHPLVQAGLLADPVVIADCKSGVSGAGRGLSLKTHFGEAHENFSAYNIGRTHRHIAEMEQETGLHIIFSPHLLPVFKGILSTMYVNLKPGTPPAAVRDAFGIYDGEPFVRLLPEGRLPELRHVVGTNMVVMGLQPVDVEAGRYIIVSCEDNLIKGAAGQAVQCMNVMFDVEETAGLI